MLQIKSEGRLCCVPMMRQKKSHSGNAEQRWNGDEVGYRKTFFFVHTAKKQIPVIT